MTKKNIKPSSRCKFTRFVGFFFASVILTATSYAGPSQKINAIYISPLSSARAATLATIFLPGATTGWIHKNSPKALPVNLNETDLERNSAAPQI